MTAPPSAITSAANPLFKELRRLTQDSTAYRRQGRVWLEGDHLCRAALARGVRPAIALFATSVAHEAGAWDVAGAKTLFIDDALFAQLSALDSPARMAFVLELPPPPGLDPHAPTVVLDRLQDAGNVGSVLRSASAFGFRQVIALAGTAALWSPKVLRAGMGAHFGLRLLDGQTSLDGLAVPLVATSSHRGDFLHEARLPWPCAWLLGHEGQGVSPELLARASLTVRIAQPGGEESLNVAAAAAICLHASSIGGSPRYNGRLPSIPYA